MLVSLERWPSLADYLGQRALAYFKYIPSGHRAAARREAPSKWPPPTQSSFQLARERRRIPASGPCARHIPIRPACGVCARGRFTNEYEVARNEFQILGADLQTLEASQGMDWRWPRNARGKSFGRWRRNTDLKASKQNQPFHDFSLPTR